MSPMRQAFSALFDWARFNIVPIIARSIRAVAMFTVFVCLVMGAAVLGSCDMMAKFTDGNRDTHQADSGAPIPQRVLNLEKGIIDNSAKIDQLGGRVDAIGNQLNTMQQGVAKSLAEMENKLQNTQQKAPESQPSEPPCRLNLMVHGQPVCVK